MKGATEKLLGDVLVADELVTDVAGSPVRARRRGRPPSRPSDDGADRQLNRPREVAATNAAPYRGAAEARHRQEFLLAEDSRFATVHSALPRTPSNQVGEHGGSLHGQSFPCPQVGAGGRITLSCAAFPHARSTRRIEDIRDSPTARRKQRMACEWVEKREVNEAYWHLSDGWPEHSLHRRHSLFSWQRRLGTLKKLF